MPYYELLLEDEFGNLYIRKSFKNFQIGDAIEHDLDEPLVPQERAQKKIGVIGTGLMGKQLAQFLAQAGYQVILYSRTKERFIAAIKKIEKGLMKTKGPHEAKIIMNRIEPITGLSKLNEAELVIETIIEDLEAKRHLLGDLSSLCPEHTIIATNTSSLPITELASAISNPERFIGMHFFNPVEKMHLVEIVYGQATSKKTIEYAMNFSEALGKTPVVVRDSPGFIVNRSLMPFINEAASLLNEGVSPNDIDNAIRLGLNHPMGPLALADLIGLDICVSIMNTLYQGYNDVRYIPSPVFNKLIQKGHLGKKTGKGFYNYDH